MRIICPACASGRSSEKPYKNHFGCLGRACFRVLSRKPVFFVVRSNYIPPIGGQQHMRTQKPLKSHEMEQLQKILQEKTGVPLKPYLLQQFHVLVIYQTDIYSLIEIHLCPAVCQLFQ